MEFRAVLLVRRGTRTTTLTEEEWVDEALRRPGRPADVLMAGDRAGPDGGAVEIGMVTLLLPPLSSPHERRLHRVTALRGSGSGLSHMRDNLSR
jgi:hypothetical protein